MATYKYTALDEERSEMRLITLLPGTFGREIRIKLETTVLSDSRIPQHQTLSYTWGSTVDRLDICIEGADGGSSLAVTKNFKEALHYLRHNTVCSRVLWIDAICINQQDFSEKNHQVARMADIYSKAKSVIVWLGPGCDGSGTAIEALTALGSEMQVDWPTTTITPSDDGSGDALEALIALPSLTQQLKLPRTLSRRPPAWLIRSSLRHYHQS